MKGPYAKGRKVASKLLEHRKLRKKFALKERSKIKKRFGAPAFLRDNDEMIPSCHELGFYCGDGGCDCDHCCGTPWKPVTCLCMLEHLSNHCRARDSSSVYTACALHLACLACTRRGYLSTTIAVTGEPSMLFQPLRDRRRRECDLRRGSMSNQRQVHSWHSFPMA